MKKAHPNITTSPAKFGDTTGLEERTPGQAGRNCKHGTGQTSTVRPHPNGGYTLAIPTGTGTARIYRGWWPTRKAAKGAHA